LVSDEDEGVEFQPASDFSEVFVLEEFLPKLEDIAGLLDLGGLVRVVVLKHVVQEKHFQKRVTDDDQILIVSELVFAFTVDDLELMHFVSDGSVKVLLVLENEKIAGTLSILRERFVRRRSLHI
jgi:hypothetical protein